MEVVYVQIENQNNIPAISQLAKWVHVSLQDKQDRIPFWSCPGYHTGWDLISRKSNAQIEHLMQAKIVKLLKTANTRIVLLVL